MASPSDAELAAIFAAPFPKSALSAFYASHARAQIHAGAALPFLVPATFFGSFVVPSVYLAFSQRRHPWLRAWRHAVFLAVVAINYRLATASASMNVGCGYGAGMIGIWGTLVAGMVLVCLDAQDCERVAKRVRWPADKSADGGDGEVEYFWESYPHEGPFSERFLWGFDMVTSLRGAGWNWAIPIIPHPPPPSKKHSNEIISVSSIPLVSRAGFTRPATKAEFLRSNITTILLGYLALDVLSILVEKDPFFMLGPRALSLPDDMYPPAHLRFIPAVLLPLYRELFFLACILTALNVIFHHIAMAQFFIFSRWFPMRAEPWMHASIFGPVSSVWNDGLSGLWGVFWHQTFRAPFTAPVHAIYGRGRGCFPGKLSALLISAFVGSGLMHSVASFAAVPATKWTEPFWFFIVQGVGVWLQRQLSALLRPLRLSKGLRRTGNVLFVLGWLYMSGPLLMDDFAAGAIWTLEPDVYSPLRVLGFGYPGDSPWRWSNIDSGFFVGKYWWEFGYGF